jgi:Flp pilus assembly protein CpaB
MRRKRSRASKVLFFLALVLAGGATLLLRGHLVRLEARAAAAGPGEPVIVAATDLDRGTVLAAGMLTVRSIPGAYWPPGALTSISEAVGRMLTADVAAGEALTTSRLAGDGGPVAALVPPGLRAVPVPVAVPPGLLAPGDRVDVLATFGAGQPHTEIVVESAEVLSLLESGGGVFEGAASVVLLVSQDSAKRLAYARSFADLSLAVASPEETY